MKAVRLEPLTIPGILILDGEEMKYEPHQCQVCHRLLKVMFMRRKVIIARESRRIMLLEVT